MKINDLLKKIIHNKFIVSRIINNKAVIFNLKNKKIIHLNQTAAKIWDLINKKQTLPEIVKVISKDYRIFPKEAEKDLIDFLFILFKELTSMKNKSLGESSYIKERDSVYKNILKQAQIKKIPFYSLIELTYNCNLKCRHCYISPLKKEELKLNSILKIIQELKENNCLELTFSGGEPLVRPDFFKILEFAKINNFAITIKTNGTLIDSKIAEEIAQFYPYEVHLSIYSLNSKIHDFITQKPGSLEKTIKSLYFLLEKNINLKISTPLMKFNFLEHKEIKKFAHKLGISAQSDPIILMKNNGNLNPLKLRLNKREWEKFYLENPQELKEIKIINPDKIPCGAGHRMCAVSPYGELYPCPGFRLSAGNLIENNFSSIWKYSKILKDIRGIKNKNLKDCVNCKINSYCSRCPGTAYQEEKNLFAKVKTACQLAEINRNTRKFIK